MSNIFEIDGELEDNEDEKGQEQSSENQDSEHDEELGAVIMEDDESDAEDEIPWYDKVLAEDDNADSDSNADDLDEATKAEFDNDDEIEATPDIPEIDEAEIEEESNEKPTAHVDPNDPFATGLKKVFTDDNEAENLTDEVNDIEEADQNEVDDVEADSEVESDEDLEPEAAVELAIAAAAMSEDDDQIETKKQPEEAAPQEKAKEKKVEEQFDDIFPRKEKSGGIAAGSIVFGILFLITLGLLSYYQFYDGHGFHMSFQHKSVAHDGDHSASNSEHDLDPTLEKMREDNEELQGTIRELKDDIKRLKAADATASAQDNSSSSTINPNQGTVYQVQVTALREYNPNFSNSSFELYIDEEDGFAKFLIGAFSSENEVKAFEKKLQKAGFDDTFIVKKVNGERVEYEP